MEGTVARVGEPRLGEPRLGEPRATRALAWTAIPTWLTGPVIPMLVAVGLGLFDAGAKSLWLDEAFSIELARRPLADVIAYVTHSELNAAPYHLLLHGWLRLFGESEAAARALSVVFGVVAVAATWTLGRRWGVAFGAALVLAVSPFFVAFEQEARGYTLLVAWSAVTTLAYCRLVERPGRWRATTYAALAALLIYVHPLGAWVVVGHGLWSAARDGLRPHRPRPLILATFGAIGLAWLPMLAFAAGHHDKIAWIPPISLDQLSDDLLQLAGAGLVAGAAIVLIAASLRRDLLAVWLVTPILGTILISVLVEPALQAKYLISVLPAGAILAARNRALLVAVLIGLSLVGVVDWYRHGIKDDWRSGVGWVSEQTRPDDGVIFSPTYLRLPFEYYGKVGVPAYPTAPWSETFGFSGTTVDPAAIRGHARIWLVTWTGSLADALAAPLADYRPQATRRFGVNGPTMTLLVRQASP